MERLRFGEASESEASGPCRSTSNLQPNCSLTEQGLRYIPPNSVPGVGGEQPTFVPMT